MGITADQLATLRNAIPKVIAPDLQEDVSAGIDGSPAGITDVHLDALRTAASGQPPPPPELTPPIPELAMPIVQPETAFPEGFPVLPGAAGEALPTLPGAVGDFMQGVNTAFTDLLDLPGELLSPVLQAAGYEDFEPGHARRMGDRYGSIVPPQGVDPAGVAGAMGAMVGLAAVTAPVLPATLMRIGAGAVVKGGIKDALGRSGRQIADTALSHPKSFIAFETAAATAAGAGGYLAAQLYPESEGAKAIGMVVGGLSPAGVVIGAKVAASVSMLNLARRVVKGVVAPVTMKGGRKRAKLRLLRTVDDENAALHALGEADVLPEAMLTPAQKINSPRLLALEKSILTSSDDLQNQASEQITQATLAIRQALDEIGGGVPLDRARATVEELNATFKSLVDTRMEIAVQKTNERILALGPQASRSVSNEIVKEELELALSAGLVQEKDLYRAIPEELPAPLTATRKKFLEILKGRRKSADPTDIPAFITQMLGKLESKTAKNGKRVSFLKGGLFDETQPVGEAITFRSRLLRTLAAERAKPGASGDKKRILNELQSAIVDEDLANLQRVISSGEFVGEYVALKGFLSDPEARMAKDAIDAARNFSNLLNKSFRQGPVGSLLGTNADRGPTTIAGLTLEKGLVKGGPVGRETAKALEEAVRFGGNQPRMQAAVEDFLKTEFLRRSVVGGELNVKQANRFLKQFDEVLDMYPTLRNDLEGVQSSGEFRDLTLRRLQGISDAIDDPKVSKAALFLRAPVEKEMNAVARQRDPGAAMAKLVRLTNRDSSGEATKGLKTGFIDFLLRGAEGQISPLTNAPRISGARMFKNMNERAGKAMMQKVLSHAEQKRLLTIVNTARRIEGAETSPQSVEGIIKDVPGSALALMTRMTGTALGRFIPAKIGVGGTVQMPGLVGNFFKKALERAVRDPARKLLISAVDDEDLFRALFAEAADDDVFVRQQLNAWLVGVSPEITVPEPSPAFAPDTSASPSRPLKLRAKKAFALP